MLILAGPNGVVNRWVLASKPAVWVGLISYPVYLWHWPLLTAINLESNPLVVEYPDLIRALAVGASILLGWLSFMLVEKPVKRMQPETPRLR